LEKILCVIESSGKLIDGGSNVCITGNLLDVSDIAPIDISMALDGASTSLDDRITKRGLLPLTLSDGTVYYQTCFFCANMVEIIFLPAAILASSNVFCFWNQEGCKDPSVPNCIRFINKDGLLSMYFDLECLEGLYNFSLDVFAANQDNPVHISCCRTIVLPSADINRAPSKFVPTSRAPQVESEVWLLRLGLPGEGQLNVLHSNVIGTPAVF
jgi:hypothetical protein